MRDKILVDWQRIICIGASIFAGYILAMLILAATVYIWEQGLFLWIKIAWWSALSLIIAFSIASHDCKKREVEG